MPDLPHLVVAENVRAEMIRQDLTALDLGAQLGLKRSAMSRRLTGDVPFTALEVWRLAQILAVPIESLFSGV